MPPKILSIVDPLSSLNPLSDTTLAIMEEADARGLVNFACETKHIFLKNGRAHFLCAPIIFKNSVPAFKEALYEVSIDDFSLVLMRKDPPVDSNFLAALMMLKCHDKKKTCVVNDPDALLIANEKLFGLSTVARFFPPTVVSSEQKIIVEAARTMGKCVIKPLFKAGGSGVMVFNYDDKNFNSAIELLSNSFKEPIIVQEYIKNASYGDKRILLLGGEILGVILRKPQANDHRANFHAGGSAHSTDLTKMDLQIVEALRPHLQSLGLHFVGIDVIDDKLTEINVTSPTCLREMESLLGKNVDTQSLRAKVLDYLLGLIA